MSEKIPGDRLLLALISVVRTLVMELSNKGVMDAADFVATLHQLATAHRETGDPNNLASALDAIGDHLEQSA